MKCFVCSNSTRVYTLSSGRFNLSRCPFCYGLTRLFLTVPQMRQGSKFFEELVSMDGVTFLGSDKLLDSCYAVELGQRDKRISNLYVYNTYNEALIDEDSNIKTPVKQVRGRGEIIEVQGDYLKKMVAKHMVGFQKEEINKSTVFTEKQKKLLHKSLKDTMLRPAKTSLGTNVQLLML